MICLIHSPSRRCRTDRDNDGRPAKWSALVASLVLVIGGLAVLLATGRSTEDAVPVASDAPSTTSPPPVTSPPASAGDTPEAADWIRIEPGSTWRFTRIIGTADVSGVTADRPRRQQRRSRDDRRARDRVGPLQVRCWRPHSPRRHDADRRSPTEPSWHFLQCSSIRRSTCWRADHRSSRCKRQPMVVSMRRHGLAMLPKTQVSAPSMSRRSRSPHRRR